MTLKEDQRRYEELEKRLTKMVIASVNKRDKLHIDYRKSVEDCDRLKEKSYQKLVDFRKKVSAKGKGNIRR